MKKVLVLGKIHDAGLRILRDSADIEFTELAEHVPEIFDHLPETDAIIVRMTKIDQKVIDAAPNLKIIARHGVGYEAVDVDALTKRKIPLALAANVEHYVVTTDEEDAVYFAAKDTAYFVAGDAVNGKMSGAYVESEDK